LAKSHFKIFIILLQINNWDQYSANQNLVKITSIEGEDNHQLSRNRYTTDTVVTDIDYQIYLTQLTTI